MISPFVQLSSVSKSYLEAGTQHFIFKNLDLDVAQGELVALLGRSGSGKSTLLNLVSGIDQTETGQIQIDGTLLSSLQERQRTLFRRHTIGFVFQFFNLIPTLTVEENLLLPLELVGRANQHRNQIKPLLHRLGLAQRFGSFPDRLSGGEQQRIAILRAMIHSPKLLLADEPTGNLDQETGEQVLTFMVEQLRQCGGTALLATHSQEVAKRADRIVQIQDRRLVESKTRTQVS